MTGSYHCGKLLLLLSALLLFNSAIVVRAAAIQPGQQPRRANEAAIAGTLTIVWGDAHNAAAPPTTAYFLTTPAGRRELSIEDLVSTANLWRLNGQKVTVWTIEDTSSPVMPLRVTRIEPASQSKQSNKLEGNLPYLSLLCEFPDGDGVFNSLSFYQNMYGSAAPRLNHYWQELSYGAISVNGSGVAGSFTMPHPASYYTLPGYSYDIGQIANDCLALADPSVDFSAYYGINLMFNVTSDMWIYAFGGGWYGQLDGVDRSIATTWLPTWAWGYLSVVEHEMGHSFGLPHSSGPYGFVYDNPWDVMSNDRYPCGYQDQEDAIYGCIAQHTIGFHKAELGWIGDDEIYTAGVGNHSIEIEALTAPDSGWPRLIIIPFLGSGDLFYTVEAREMVGYDEGTPGTGVVIHHVNRMRSTGSPANVIDGDNNGDTNDDGTLWSVGDVFQIESEGITISVAKKTYRGFVVNIQVTNPGQHVLFIPLIHPQAN